jgi:hypothetical protein
MEHKSAAEHQHEATGQQREVEPYSARLSRAAAPPLPCGRIEIWLGRGSRASFSPHTHPLPLPAQHGAWPAAARSTPAECAAIQTTPDAAASAPAPGRSVEEQLRSFDSLPLFMKDLPAEGAAPEEGDAANTALEALQSLAHDGTPDGESVCAAAAVSPLTLLQRSRRTSRRRATSTSRASATARRPSSTRRLSTPTPRMPCCARRAWATVPRATWSCVRRARARAGGTR